MPLYEYQCKTCGREFERLVRSADRDKGGACPDCGNATERKISLFSSVGVESSPTPQPGPCGRCGDVGPCASGGF